MGCGLITYLFTKYNYYRAPEGEDPIGKIVGLGQYGIYTGTFCALYDACLWSHCANAPQFFNTFGYWVIPLTGMGVAFSTVTYAMTHLRKKDDKINYIAGTLAAGGVFHAWQKCIRKSAWVTCTLLLYAVLKKQAIQDGVTRYVMLTEYDEELHRKWVLPWRNVYYRNYLSKPWFPHDKEDYYINHY